LAHTPSDIDLVESVRAIAGEGDLFDDLREQLTETEIIVSVDNHDDERLLDWLLASMSLQGISDTVALRLS